uniref:Secreted protein n=1 Tax=Arundo donax TaxID=35708 RepID=A0A0A9E3N1_ARUDO
MLVVVLKAIVTMMLANPIMKFTSGMYTWPSYFFEVWITWILGRQPSDNALERTKHPHLPPTKPGSVSYLLCIAIKVD